MGFLEDLKDTLRTSPVAETVTAGRYGEGRDPYRMALGNAPTLGYPVPGASTDVGEAQRYNAANLAAQRFGPVPLVTNALHELLLSHFAEGEKGPSWKRWKAGNRGVIDALRGRSAP